MVKVARSRKRGLAYLLRLQNKTTILDKIVEKIVKRMFHFKTRISNDQNEKFPFPLFSQNIIELQLDLFCSPETNIVQVFVEIVICLKLNQTLCFAPHVAYVFMIRLCHGSQQLKRYL